MHVARIIVTPRCRSGYSSGTPTRIDYQQRAIRSARLVGRRLPGEISNWKSALGFSPRWWGPRACFLP